LSYWLISFTNGVDKGLKRIKIIVAITMLLLIFIAVGVYLHIIISADKPANTEPVQHVVIVKPGQGFLAFSQRLHKAGIINNLNKFKLFAYIKGYEKRIKAGEYLLSSAMSPKEILEIVVNGKVRLHRLTVPEGYNLRQIARIVAEAGFGTEADFLRAATDTDQVHMKGIDSETFEGYLFPDTYYFPKGVRPEDIISIMVKRFWTIFKPEWKKRAEVLGFSIHQIVTFASIIEKETGAAFERPIISSVFHNRLKRRMRLQSDPTVIYGIKDFDGNLTRKHLSQKTPYDTYRINGLPPGPIANAGIEAIEAALYPADTKFLYFVSKKDNTHKFSANIRDHNNAVRKYQLRR
jgi:UPF0755 protein